ncbi:minor tail protein [Mycobacterium phage Gaia]|uniref:Minor tail protein n=1 Tax=Mycobacterium phage Gaia TaxID=1486472 RepID=A0A068F2C8_9CAUD|nr:minor tail protein [Mycobacterium phage Gaia]AID58834.1 minor tail protein [Mycobacterium phage Gaia]AYQ99957.1 hypothetical protein PBI_NEBKISS_15 [Mycobacterium phage Nebkiss]
MRTRTLEVIAPITPDMEVDVLRWLNRESFEIMAEDRGLMVIDYIETELDPKTISRESRELMPDARWVEFKVVCKYQPEIEELLNQHLGRQDD